MWFFELRDKVRRGFRVESGPEPRVTVTVDGARRLYLPLGTNLARLLSHPEDQKLSFCLDFGRLELAGDAAVLDALERADALKDEQALLLVNRITDPAEGEELLYHELSSGMPEPVAERLLLFQPGQAVAITYLSRVAAQTTELRWDGRRLHEHRALH